MRTRSTTLGELCAEGGGEIQTGPFGSQLHARDYVSEGVPSVMPQNIGDNVIVADGIARVSPEDADRLSRYLLREGDIVYSRRGDVEKRALVRVENAGWLCGTGCLRVRLGAATPHDPRYLAYALGAGDVRDWIVRHAVGATMPNLNTSILGAVPLQVPRPLEQRAIADVLTALDDKIAANARLREGAERLALMLVESSGSPVPLGEVVTHRKRVVDPSALTSDRVAHFSLPAFDAGRMPETVEPRTIKSSKFLVTSPSVLVSKLNPRFPRTWDVATVTVPDLPALASTEFLVLEPRFSTSTVLWALLSQSTFGAVLESKVAGTSGSHQRVRPEDLLGTPVPDPRAMSDELKDQVTSLGLRAIQTRVESDRLAAIRDALLPALMSGRLRVRDAQRDSAGRSQVG